jgi:penicillin-binding protein-related factor A (putative recombinase)
MGLIPHAGLRKKAGAVRQGRAAVASGRSLEAMLERTHAAYARGDYGVVTKLHPETVGPPTARRFKSPAAVDYLGWLRTPAWGTYPPGTSFPVAFDAKATGGAATYTLDTRPRALEVERRQLRFLTEFSQGGTVFLLVYDRPLEMAFLVGLDGIRELLRTGRTTLRSKHRDGTVTSPWPQCYATGVAGLARGLPPLNYLTALFPEMVP